MKTRLEMLNPDASDKRRKMTREELIIDILKNLRGSHGCGFILEQDVGLLHHRYDVDAKSVRSVRNELDSFLPYAASQINNCFLVIHNIDCIEEQKQSVFFSLAKDRCIHEYHDLSENVIIVFTLSSADGCKKVLHDLWNLGNDLTNLTE